MGRSIAGSYAEYTAVPASSVIPVETSLGWDRLAAVPESYAVAWTCLPCNLQLPAGQRLVVRGGTSSLGALRSTLPRSWGWRSWPPRAAPTVPLH